MSFIDQSAPPLAAPPAPSPAAHSAPCALEHGWSDPARETWLTFANAITALRTIAAVLLAGLALSEHSVVLVAIGYAVYWGGDILDGAVARWLDEETRIGAAADIVCDRLCTAVLCAGLLVTVPHSRLPLAVFLLQFLLLDLLLSLRCLRWPILSPNYFGLIDVALYRWNWSKPAKACNSAAVVLVAVLTGSAAAGVAAALAGLAVKAASLRRMSRVAASSGDNGLPPSQLLRVTAAPAGRALR
jgi:CDP-diacylglycerol--glycerol-3-phosphate 3-phosphatidyltransferase